MDAALAAKFLQRANDQERPSSCPPSGPHRSRPGREDTHRGAGPPGGWSAGSGPPRRPTQQTATNSPNGRSSPPGAASHAADFHESHRPDGSRGPEKGIDTHAAPSTPKPITVCSRRSSSHPVHSCLERPNPRTYGFSVNNACDAASRPRGQRRPHRRTPPDLAARTSWSPQPPPGGRERSRQSRRHQSGPRHGTSRTCGRRGPDPKQIFEKPVVNPNSRATFDRDVLERLHQLHQTHCASSIQLEDRRQRSGPRSGGNLRQLQPANLARFPLDHQLHLDPVHRASPPPAAPPNHASSPRTGLSPGASNTRATYRAEHPWSREEGMFKANDRCRYVLDERSSTRPTLDGKRQAWLNEYVYNCARCRYGSAEHGG